MTTTMDFQAMFTAKAKTIKSRRVTSILQGRSRRGGTVACTGVVSMLQVGQASERSARLERLRMEIAAGTYFVSSSDVAECLMRSMLKG